MSGLPIEAALPDLLAGLKTHNQAVLQAPPGAGKTTRVPLFLLEENLFDGRIVMLEPRRLAARAAAQRMADTLGETVGQTVGYAMRGERKVGAATKIEVVTEGILTRMIQSDPELTGISCVIFDEFHERSLNADLGLALCLEIRGALREDLCLLPMSATLDAAPVAQLMGAPVVTSEGRSYPVDIRYLSHPWQSPNKRARFETAMAALITQAVEEDQGSILAFLPGEGEIRRVQSLLNGLKGVEVLPLFGAMPFAKQRAAIAPSSRRKVVLATSIAETSLTIEGITVVVDGGLARRAQFDAGSGMSRLVTERVTRAEATQRAGRAGRLSQGVCYRLWTKGEDGAMAAFPPPDIQAADLASLALELARWGASAPTDLPFLTQPRASDFEQAQALLRDLSALGQDNRITPHGQALAKMPLHPRLAHMTHLGGPSAPLVAALLSNRDILNRPAPSDLSLRWSAARNPKSFEADHPYTINRAALAQVKDDAKRLKAMGTDHSLAELAALAYPDRIGLRRAGDAPRYLLSGGKGAVFEDGDPLGTSRMIVVTDTDGHPREARIRQAIPITEREVKALFADNLQERFLCDWSKRDRDVTARAQLCLGALVLEDRTWRDCPPEAYAAALIEGIRDLGLTTLPWSKTARLFQKRSLWARTADPNLPDLNDAALLETLENWLLPHLIGCRKRSDLDRLDLTTLLKAQVDWDQMNRLDNLAPASLTAPTGTKMMVDYGGEQPMISVRLQELFGLTTHPTIAGQPLLIELLSPAQKPVQLTADLPNFWKTSYGDVRKDMRGRYPKHPWPEDPTTADPTRRVKPRAF